MNLKKLVNDAKEKLSVDEVINMMCSNIACDADRMRCCYREMYEKAYGNALTKDYAQEWVRGLKVTDGSGRENGQKWTIEQTTDVGNKIELDWSKISKVDWYAAMNIEYSKHFKTAKSFGLDADPLFYARIARDEWCAEHSKPMFDYYIENIDYS